MLSLSLKYIRCFSSSTSAAAAATMIEKNLYSLPISIRNHLGESISLNAVYQDSNPNGSIQGTCIGLHGCPGSHLDFKYIEPLLTKVGIRFIGINYPGLGFSSYDERLKNDNYERNQFVQKVIDSLNLKESLVFLGHSRGTENALMAAAENQEKTKGLILLNPIGITVHRGIKPQYVVHWLAKLWKLQQLRLFSNWLLYHLYNYLKLKVSTGHEAGVCITTMTTTLLDKQKPYINSVNNKSSIKVFIGASGKDQLIEDWISKEFMALFKDVKIFETITVGDEPETTKKVLKEMKESKSIGTLFINENHFLQKFRANLVKEFIEKCLNSKD
uniref:Serine aminopeptidase S33 domain-containing protein n=1 Tax=Panagrolaimus sp. PS1159 TaxID=55785 RepID=A0AC35GRG9_9BILA